MHQKFFMFADFTRKTSFYWSLSHRFFSWSMLISDVTSVVPDTLIDFPLIIEAYECLWPPWIRINTRPNSFESFEQFVNSPLTYGVIAILNCFFSANVTGFYGRDHKNTIIQNGARGCHGFPQACNVKCVTSSRTTLYIVVLRRVVSAALVYVLRCCRWSKTAIIKYRASPTSERPTYEHPHLRTGGRRALTRTCAQLFTPRTRVSPLGCSPRTCAQRPTLRSRLRRVDYAMRPTHAAQSAVCLVPSESRLRVPKKRLGTEIWNATRLKVGDTLLVQTR
jgi:hypothetical protein